MRPMRRRLQLTKSSVAATCYFGMCSGERDREMDMLSKTKTEIKTQK